MISLAGCAGERARSREAIAPAGVAEGAGARDGLSVQMAAREATRRLRELAEQSRRTPGEPISLPALGAEWGNAPTAAGDRVAMSLADAVATLDTLGPAERGEGVVGDAERAQRLYASGRLRLLDGDVNGALREWEGALTDDPSSPTLAGEVGMLQIRAGRRSTGLSTLRRAVEMGLRDAEPLRVLAREEHRAGDVERALVLLAAARRDGTLARDAVQRRLVEADLGERLADGGYLSAAREALASIADLEPAAFGSSALNNPEFAELVRRRGQLLLRAGDIGAQVGAWEAAGDSYRAALGAAAVDEGLARLRLAGVSLRAGNPADAALQVIESLPADRLPQPWHAEVARALGAQGDGEVARLLARAVRVPAEGEATRTGLARRAELAAVAASTDAIGLLTEAAALAGPWGDRSELLGGLLDAVDALDVTRGASEPRARVEAMLGVLARDPLAAPECAEALVAHGRDLAAMRQVIAGGAGTSSEGAALAAALALRLEQPASALEFAKQGGEARSVAARGALASARCAALVQLGRDAEARSEAGAFAAGLGGEGAAGAHAGLVARVHLAAGDVEAAGSALAGVLESEHAGLEELALAARVQTQRGRADRALELLARAAAIDPDATAIADARIALLRPGLATSDEAGFAAIVRGLRERDPSSELVRRLVTLDLAQRGLWRQARIEAMALMDDRGMPREAIEVLASAWQRGGDKGAVEAGVATLREWQAARPDSPVLAGHLARALALAGKAAEAESVLAKQYELTPLDELGRQREAVLRETLGKPEEAQRAMLARLANRPATFANQIELAQALARSGAYEEAAKSLREAKFDRAALTPAQVASVVGVARLLKAESAVSAEQQRGAMEVIEVARDVQGEEGLPPDVAALRVDLLCVIAPMEAGAILDAIDEFAQGVSRAARGANAATVGRAREEATGRVAQRFLTLEDATPLLRLLEELYVRARPVNDVLGAEWIRMSIIRGDGEDNRRLVMFWQDMDRLYASLAALQLPIEWEGDTIEQVRPEFAYLVANALNGQVREVAAAEVYRLALELNPRHAWSGNNYGYMILERGGDIAEAARLIEMAYEQLPNEASVTDTIGWLRYKQGQLEDQTLADGTVRLGAVSLLEKCVEMPDGAGNWEIHDHLGDALWRRGRDDADRARAVAEWQTALTSVRDDIAMASMANRQSPQFPDLRRREAEIQAKVRAAGDPAVARDAVPVPAMSIPTTFTPLPEPKRSNVQEREQNGVDLLMP